MRPLLVSALRPVVLLPECLAPRLIRDLLDLPNSRLDFQVCPAGEPEPGGRGCGGLPGIPGRPGPLALPPCLSLPCRKPVWGGAVLILSTRSPQGAARHAWAGQEAPRHPGVCREGRCWGRGGCLSGPGG